jgi:hypothetical protein
MLGGMSMTSESLTLANTSPGEEEANAWATARSMLRVLAITKAAGTPLPVASPTTMPKRPSSSSKKS